MVEARRTIHAVLAITGFFVMALAPVLSAYRIHAAASKPKPSEAEQSVTAILAAVQWQRSNPYPQALAKLQAAPPIKILSVWQSRVLTKAKLRDKITLALTNDKEINTESHGWNYIALNRGAIEKLTADELDALIAHEIGHCMGYASGDYRQVDEWARELIADAYALELMANADVPRSALVSMLGKLRKTKSDTHPAVVVRVAWVRWLGETGR